jgi:hypothetical protein
VSRFSIPGDSGGEDVAGDLDPPGEASDEIRRVRFDRDELRDGPSALRDHDPLRLDAIEDGEALLLELRGWNRLHRSDGIGGQLR